MIIVGNFLIWKWRDTTYSPFNFFLRDKLIEVKVKEVVIWCNDDTWDVQQNKMFLEKKNSTAQNTQSRSVTTLNLHSMMTDYSKIFPQCFIFVKLRSLEKWNYIPWKRYHSQFDAVSCNTQRKKKKYWYLVTIASYAFLPPQQTGSLSKRICFPFLFLLITDR